MRIAAFWKPHSKLLRRSGVVAFFALLIALFFWKILFYPGQYHIPYDLHDYHYSLAHEIFLELRQGHFPLWDPYSYCGMPLAGNIQAQLFYWPTLLLLKLSDWIYGAFPYRFLEYQLISHYLVAALGVFLLARSFNLSPLSAMLTGTIYTFGGFLASMTQHLGLINGAAWIPWVFFLARRYFDTQRPVYGVAWGVALAMVILAGFPALIIAVFLYLGIISLVLVVYLCLRSGPRTGLRFLVLSIIFLALAIGLSAVQLLPAFEANQYSSASQHHQWVGLGGLAREGYITLFIPGFYGVGTDHYWGNQESTHTYQYLGVGALILSLICLLTAKRKDMLLVMALTTFSLFWTLGEEFYVSTIIWRLMPSGIRGGIYTFCAELFFDLGVALMAGVGLDTLRNACDDSRETSRIRTALLSVAGILIGFAVTSLVFHHLAQNIEFGTAHRIRLIRIYQGFNLFIILSLAYGSLIIFRLRNHLRWGWVAWSILLMTFAELFGFGAGKRFNTTVSYQQSELGPDMFQGQQNLLNSLKRDPDYRGGKYMRIDTWSSSRIWCTSSRLWSLENVNGDDPLLLRDYQAFRLKSSRFIEGRRFLVQPSAAISLNLLSVKYVVVSSDLRGFRPPENLELVQDGYYRIFENKSFLPRAFFVPHVAFEPDLKSFLKRISSPGFSLLDYVVADEERFRRTENEPCEKAPGRATVQITSYQPNEIALSVNNASAGFLVLNEIFYPGWQARVDGERREIFRANGIFRGLRMQGGSHHVVMSYKPRSVRLGAFTSLATLLLTVLGLCLRPNC